MWVIKQLWHNPTPFPISLTDEWQNDKGEHCQKWRSPKMWAVETLTSSFLPQGLASSFFEVCWSQGPAVTSRTEPPAVGMGFWHLETKNVYWLVIQTSDPYLSEHTCRTNWWPISLMISQFLQIIIIDWSTYLKVKHSPGCLSSLKEQLLETVFSLYVLSYGKFHRH